MSTYSSRTEVIAAIIAAIEESPEVTDARVEYDIDAIADAVIGTYADGYAQTVSTDEFWQIVAAHARFPVDSTFHACCNGIGGHADGCPAGGAGTWRDLSDQLTEQTRGLLELAEQRGDDPAELRRYAEDMLDSERFQLDCERAAKPPAVPALSASQWCAPDDEHPETYRELTVYSRTVADVTVDVAAEVNLDGKILRSFIYLGGRETNTLSAAEARALADALGDAAAFLDQL